MRYLVVNLVSIQDRLNILIDVLDLSLIFALASLIILLLQPSTRLIEFFKHNLLHIIVSELFHLALKIFSPVIDQTFQFVFLHLCFKRNFILIGLTAFDFEIFSDLELSHAVDFVFVFKFKFALSSFFLLNNIEFRLLRSSRLGRRSIGLLLCRLFPIGGCGWLLFSRLFRLFDFGFGYLLLYYILFIQYCVFYSDETVLIKFDKNFDAKIGFLGDGGWDIEGGQMGIKSRRRITVEKINCDGVGLSECERLGIGNGAAFIEDFRLFGLFFHFIGVLLVVGPRNIDLVIIVLFNRIRSHLEERT